MNRQKVFSASPYESAFGFSRATRVGNHVWVSGTAPICPDGSCTEDVVTQARLCFEIALEALGELGAAVHHVVRTRMFIVDPDEAEAVGRIHGEVFASVRPAATMVVVARLLDRRWRIEIEAE